MIAARIVVVWFYVAGAICAATMVGVAVGMGAAAFRCLSGKVGKTR